MKTAFLTLLLITLIMSVMAHAVGDYAQVHGSGTTNPQNCFALIMQQFMDRAKLPIKMTYRGIGTGTGQAEFLGIRNNSSYIPYTDFGCGDIPLTTTQYTSSVDAIGDKMVVQLPFLLGAVSFFHSIPNVTSASKGLNMTGCLLARIFKRNITMWDHPDILKINAELSSSLPQRNYPIKVAHRVLGSSSTGGITNYLYKSCPQYWDPMDVGLSIKWPNGTMACDGSDLMVSCIADNPGTIGYVESGRGWSQLQEVLLQNSDGRFINSQIAAKENGIVSAASNKTFPSSYDEDFGGMEFFDEPGNSTWPIVLMSYVYVRKDIYKFITDIDSAGLLKQFLIALYTDSYISQCVSYGFALPPETVRNSSLMTIKNMMIWTDPNSCNNDAQLCNNVTQWIFESSTTMPYAGQGPYVISSKRFTGAQYQISSQSTNIGQFSNNVRDLKQDIAMVVATLTEPNTRVYTNYDFERLQVALVLGALSFVMWMIFLLFLLIRRLCCK